MKKTSITKILIFFLLVGIENINASSNNLRKSKNIATSPLFIDSISSIFMEENWSCCDVTNDPSSSPTFIPTESPTSSPTYTKKKLTASDGTDSDHFGYSCSMSGDLVIIGAHFSGGNNEGAAYL